MCYDQYEPIVLPGAGLTMYRTNEAGITNIDPAKDEAMGNKYWVLQFF
jgi:hypothetical protein